MAMKFYFDDREGEGLSRATSHPAFTAHFADDLYYDCVDEEAPFGSDAGNDLLAALEDEYRSNGVPGNIRDWLFEAFDGYGFKFASSGIAGMTSPEELAAVDAEDEFIIDELDSAIIAAAFGQVKISGTLHKDLKELAGIALQRRRSRLYGDVDENDEAGSVIFTLINDLKRFPV